MVKGELRSIMGESKLLILDLDNTLYDWMEAYTESIMAQIAFISNETKIDRESIQSSFKRVFKKYGSVEVPYAVYELDMWEKVSINNSRLKELQESSCSLFMLTLKQTLKLYPTVLETLKWAKSNNITIVGLSDAFSYWINERLKILGIIGYFDQVFATKDDIIQIENFHYHEKICSVSANANKPNPDIIDRIKKSYKIDTQSIFIVGDSIDKDIKLAQETGIHGVWAKYGTNHKKGYGTYLSKLTPWTKGAHNKVSIKPHYTISSFDEIIKIIG